MKIENGGLEDTVKEQRKLAWRARRVFFRELEHRVLDDIQRQMVVTNSIERVLVGAALNLGEKLRKLLVGSQTPRLFLGVSAVPHARRSGFPAPRCAQVGAS